ADRQADHPRQGPAGEQRAVLGQDDQGCEVSFRGDEPADLRRSRAVHGLMPGGRPKTKARPDAVKSVSKVLDIVEHLAAARCPVSLSDIARLFVVNGSPAFRLV